MDAERECNRAQELLQASALTDALGTVNDLREQILSSREDLRILYQRWSQRNKKDLKVAPGSSTVELAWNDARFALCSACVIKSKIVLVDRDFDTCEASLREAYMWCPKSPRVLYLLAELLRLTSCSTNPNQLLDSENIYRKCISAAADIVNKSITGEPHILLGETEFGTQAANREVLLMLQSGRTANADEILRGMNYHFRISDKVLNYKSAPRVTRPATTLPFVRVFDNFLQAPQLKQMQHIFRSESPFWKEHDYDETENFSRQVGYFSYLYEFRDRPAKHFVEHMIDGVFKTMSAELPELAEATIAEWWVHSRPHCCGHQMHFDSDETRIENGHSPQHPIISCVLFVREAGGPTLMTDQTLSGDLASKGWMIDSKLNRLLAFDSRYLHGVIPGQGVAVERESRRLTFMVGFWRKIEAENKGKGRYGAGQPFPFDDDALAWPKEFAIHDETSISDSSFNASQPADQVGFVEPVWEELIAGGRRSDYKDFFQGF